MSLRIELLKQACQKSQEDLGLLRENYTKQELLIQELNEQRNQYKQLYEQHIETPATALMGASSNASSSCVEAPVQHIQRRRESLDTMQSELNMWKSKADRLQETLAYLNEDRQTHEKSVDSTNHLIENL